VTGTGDDRLARQLGAMQEEQQADGQVGQPAEHHRALAGTGQHGGISTTPSKARVKLSNSMRRYFITGSVLSLCKARR
jgi:hypothetical protein